MEEYIKPISNEKIKIPKFKGHTKITLTNINTKEETIIESDNKVTNAVASMFKNDYYNLIDMTKNDFFPVRNLFGGVMCFESSIDNENAIFPPSEDENHLVAHCGDNSDSTIKNAKLGIRSNIMDKQSQYMSADGKSWTWIWDFSPDKGNGRINSVCLTSANGGNVGTTPTTEDFSIYHSVGEGSYHISDTTAYGYNRPFYTNVYNHNTQKIYNCKIVDNRIRKTGSDNDNYCSIQYGIEEQVIKNFCPINYGLNTGYHFTTKEEWDKYNFERETKLLIPIIENEDNKIADPWNYTKNYIIYNPSLSSGKGGYTFLHRQVNGKWYIADITRNETTYELSYVMRKENLDLDSIFTDILIPKALDRPYCFSIPVKNNTWIYMTSNYITGTSDVKDFYKFNLNTLEIKKLNKPKYPDDTKAEWIFPYTFNLLDDRTQLTSFNWFGDIYVGYNFIINGDTVYPNTTEGAFKDHKYAANPKLDTPMVFFTCNAYYDNKRFKAGYFSPYLATINNLPNPVDKSADQAMRIEYTLTEVEG